jgi:hypothetical protein
MIPKFVTDNAQGLCEVLAQRFATDGRSALVAEARSSP